MEYTLVLVVTVALLVGLMNVIFKPLGDFLSNYMGKYTACLLEYGELPTLGHPTPSEVDEDSECNKKFEAGTWAAGRPPTDSGGANQKTAGKKPNSRDSESSENGSGGGYAGSSSRGGGRLVNRSSTRGTDGASQQGAPGKVVEIALENGGSGGFFSENRESRSVVRRDKTTYIGLSGLSEEERKKVERKAQTGARSIVGGEGITPPQKKLAVKPPPVREIANDDGEGFTIGNFIRFLIIAAIIIALIIFVGGQVYQMSKSDN